MKIINKIKKPIFFIFIGILLCCSVYFFEMNLCRLTYSKNEEEANDVLNMAYDVVEGKIDNDNVDSEKIEQVNYQKENDIIGVLLIDKINIEAPIKQGTSQQIMQTSIGHFIESDLWDGNVSLASHNSGTSMHYFEEINKLEINDKIVYITEFGKREYKVQSITKIKDTDWSMVNGVHQNCEEKNIDNNQNTITLITCINGQSDYRLCVRGVEIQTIERM